ncbi:MAG: hypothetical protein ABMA01_09785 [Chthoniobacteraceae bacterium]
MNTDPEKIRALLDDVLPPSGDHCGPSSAEILSMLRNERQRRRRLHGSVALLAIIVVAAGAVFWNHQPPAVTPVAQAPVEPATFVIHRVNDEQLFALLEGMPAALMKMPNGDSTLLVIEP